MTRSRCFTLATLLLFAGMLWLAPFHDALGQEDCKDSKDGC